MSPGNGIRMTNHRHCIFRVSSYPNPLEYTNEYVKALLLPHWLGECNEVVICIKYCYLLRHHVFEAVRDGLICCHEPNLVTDNDVFHKIEYIGGKWAPHGWHPKTPRRGPCSILSSFPSYFHYTNSKSGDIRPGVTPHTLPLSTGRSLCYRLSLALCIPINISYRTSFRMPAISWRLLASSVAILVRCYCPILRIYIYFLQF